MNQAINIIFDGPPGPESGRFIEVETDDGRSIGIGKWIERKDGLWALRIDRLPQEQLTTEAREKVVKLRQALAELVGASDKESLIEIGKAVLVSSAPEEDKAAALHAIRTLIEIPELSLVKLQAVITNSEKKIKDSGGE